MLKRISQLIAAAGAAIVIAAPVADARDRHGGGYRDRDGGRHVARDYRDYRDYRDHRDWRGRGYRAERRHYRKHKRQARRYHRDYRHRHFRHFGPRVVWLPRHRHRHYRGWHHDRHYNLAILFAALETVRTGFAYHWRDPDSRVSGHVTPTRTYRLASGQYCREYQQRIIVDNNPVEGYGRACRQPDGSWQTANN